MIKASTSADRQLLEGIVRGKNASVQEVYNLALPSIIRWIKENNGTESDARDIFQEALLALFRKLENGDFTLTCTLKSFLRILCRNLWLNRLRNKNNQMSPLEEVESYELDQDLLHRLEQSEKEKLFFKHFDTLGDKCQRILKYYFDKMPLKQIASKLDTSENYIKKRKFFCKEKLIKAIQADPLFTELKNH